MSARRWIGFAHKAPHATSDDFAMKLGALAGRLTPHPLFATAMRARNQQGGL